MVPLTRSSGRFRITRRVPVTVRAQALIVRGRVVNLSAYGCFIEMRGRLSDRDEVSLLVEVPSAVIELSATSVWCNRHGQGLTARLPEGWGFQFLVERKVMVAALAAVRLLQGSGYLAEETGSVKERWESVPAGMSGGALFPGRL